MEIEKILNNNFVIVDLGSSNAKVNKFLAKFNNQITHIELDALANSENKNENYYKKISINKAIHFENGLHTFYEREYMACSSFLEFQDEVGPKFNIEKLIQTKKIHSFDCITLNEIVEENKLTNIDFLKIDLEGLDFDIIKSIENNLENVNVIQAEIRFKPFFKGESYFFEICKYLHDKGFEFINFYTLDEWKLNTKNQKQNRDGLMAWGDFVFFKILDVKAPDYQKNRLKQILIAKSLNFNSYAAYLFESNKDRFDINLGNEIAKNVYHLSLAEKILRELFRLISKTIFIYPIQKSLKFLFKQSRILDKYNQIIY